MLTICKTKHLILVLCLLSWRDLFCLRCFPCIVVGGGRLHASGYALHISVVRLTMLSTNKQRKPC